MPTYVYNAQDGQEGCNYCRNGFETKHGMSDPPLEECPSCGGRVHRVIVAPNINTRGTNKTRLSDSNLKRHGFHKLMKEDKGKYRIT